MTTDIAPTLTVVCDTSRTTLTLGAEEPLLTGLIRHGYSHRYGCRRGGCGICKVDIVAGEVRYASTVADSVLNGEERNHGVALSCRAIPATAHVEIRLREEVLTHFLPWRLMPPVPAGFIPQTTS
jgi:CDP-4-dehydro-6-deoxyglucose reductase